MIGNKGPGSASGGALLRESLSPTPMPRLLGREWELVLPGVVQFLGVRAVWGNRGCSCQNSHLGSVHKAVLAPWGVRPTLWGTEQREAEARVGHTRLYWNRTTHDAKCAGPTSTRPGWALSLVWTVR